DFRAGERSPANDPGRAAFLEKMAANRLRYEQEQARLAARSAGVGRAAGGGGGAGGGAAAAAERQAAQQTRLQSQLTQNEFKEQQQRENAAREHYQKLIDIQADYAAKTLEQQEQNQATSRRSKFTFYKELTSAEDIPPNVAQGLSAQYEQAFAEAQQMSQEGKAQLAADYLALKQEQIAAELAYQQELAKAREEGDKAEVARLQALAQLRKDAEQAELNNLLGGGDANVSQRDQALAGEEQRYATSQDKIGTAAEQAAQRKILAAQQSGAALAAETDELQRQADLYAKQGKGTAATGTATAAPTTAAPALPATGPNGGAVAVADATLAGLLADAVKALDGLRREMSNLASRPPLTTG
ncbi:MAG TPA: hypothetical protein DEH78_05670, partial [Solibacterales bacterium]|nr:hypothetical protein [Bryobacterales bacterium]